MTAYCFFDVREVIDPAKLEEYRQGVLAVVKQFGGRYLLMGGEVDSVEGNWQPAFPVLIEFPNLEQARQWYQSEEYRALKDLRMAGSRCDAVLMESDAQELASWQ